MVEKTEYVKVAIEPERKQRWKEAVSEKPNVGTLSGLVRLGVEGELGETPGDNGVGEEVSEAVSELVDETRQVNSRLQAMEARLGTIENAVQQDPEVSKLANEVFGVIPTREDLDQYQDPEAGPVPEWLPEDEGGPIAYSGQPADIATLLDETELQVQRAIDKLQADTARVQETDGGAIFKEV